MKPKGSKRKKELRWQFGHNVGRSYFHFPFASVKVAHKQGERKEVQS